MPFDDVPFVWRAAAALAFLTLASGIELAWRGRHAVRWRASLVIVAGALLGGLLGMLVDAVTVQVSPAYFTLGKGLEGGPGLAGRARLLGLQAGISGGTVLACALAFVAHRHRDHQPPAGLRPTLGLLLVPLAVAPPTGAVLGALGHLLAPGLDVSGWTGLPAAEARGFAAAWSAHLGVYLGGLTGTVQACLRLRQLRRRTPDQPPVTHRNR